MLIINGYIFDMATLAVQSTRVSAPIQRTDASDAAQSTTKSYPVLRQPRSHIPKLVHRCFADSHRHSDSDFLPFAKARPAKNLDMTVVIL